jgi:hypothetical protein
VSEVRRERMTNDNGLTRGRSTIAVVLATAIALIAFGVAAMWPAHAGAQGDIHVFASGEGSRARFLQFDDGALVLGDRLAGRGRLVDPATGNRVGRFFQDCVVMRRITDGPDGPRGLYRCTYELVLADGTVVVEGLDPHGPGVYTFSVLGGTGAYAGAKGEATLTDSFEGTDYVIDLAP